LHDTQETTLIRHAINLQDLLLQALRINKSAAKKLEAKLKAAKRVNEPPRLSTEGCRFMDYDHLAILMDKREGDGLWKCCQGHEVSGPKFGYV
jgi:hypothetical protein